VIVIEHNLNDIRIADWIIDLGPEGGIGGGRLVAMGRPEDVAKVSESHTGRWLAPLLKRRAPVMELSPRREPLEQVFMRLTEEDEPKSKQSTTQKITRDELSSRAPASAGS